MARDLRIAFYSDGEEVGGAEMAVRYLLEHLDPALQVAILGTSPKVVDWLGRHRPSARVVVLPPLVDKRDGASFRRHRRTIAQLRPDVFHANLRSLWSCQYALVAAHSVPGVAAIAVEHSPVASPSVTSQRLKRWTSSRLAAHVAVGDAVARTIEDLAGLPERSMRTIHNGVPIRPPAPPRAASGDRLVLAAVARLDHLKGLDLLVRVVARLPRTDLLVFGDGTERERLALLARELGVAERVSFLGWQEDAMDEAARRADVFVLPSRLEAFPLTVLEAMARGLAVVATDVGSTREIVRDGETGQLVAADDLDGLERAVAAMADPGRRRQLASAAHALVASRFSAPTMAATYTGLYEEVTGGGGRTRPSPGAARRRARGW